MMMVPEGMSTAAAAESMGTDFFVRSLSKPTMDTLLSDLETSTKRFPMAAIEVSVQPSINSLPELITE